MFPSVEVFLLVLFSQAVDDCSPSPLPVQLTSPADVVSSMLLLHRRQRLQLQHHYPRQLLNLDNSSDIDRLTTSPGPPTHSSSLSPTSMSSSAMTTMCASTPVRDVGVAGADNDDAASTTGDDFEAYCNGRCDGGDDGRTAAVDDTAALSTVVGRGARSSSSVGDDECFSPGDCVGVGSGTDTHRQQSSRRRLHVLQPTFGGMYHGEETDFTGMLHLMKVSPLESKYAGLVRHGEFRVVFVFKIRIKKHRHSACKVMTFPRVLSLFD